ncbi:Pfs domain-containing protein [Tolypocladium paradoxum]|uniref:Pfs domain-containing protein n=1 Tax=Tolypocladium paradoxum TaxID=94208 RepID=A0A2S4KW35_9HYPO|nr:Pfs domain-containing protein [Tolypocladium paradoxum]
MLDHLTGAMPRFESYLDLYPTPQLRRAMRAIYDDFIEFCLSRNILRLPWSSVDKHFDKISQGLQNHTADFQAEAQLANVKATKKWQDDILERLSKNSSHSGYSSDPSLSRLVSTLPFPRNLVFTGRHDILEEISRILQLPQADQSEILRSVTLYGMGGVGKTQIALEYAYRFRGAYSHMFWIKSETEVELRQSLTSLIEGLGLNQGGENEQRDVDRARKWLETSDGRWLLVFDNVQQVSILRRYWPRGAKGNVIITSQRPSFDEFTTKNIRIRPLTVEEGGSLILRQMHLDDGDEPTRAKAEELSEELGGSPLAITHYTGFCVASHMSLVEVLRTFQQRSVSAEIWSCNSNTSVMQYERTLSTVWDTALSSLNDDARDLLDMLAFLNPDCIPEDFLRRKSGLHATETAGFDAFKLTVMVSSLIRRNLIERNIIVDGSSLRMLTSARPDAPDGHEPRETPRDV